MHPDFVYSQFRRGTHKTRHRTRMMKMTLSSSIHHIHNHYIGRFDSEYMILFGYDYHQISLLLSQAPISVEIMSVIALFCEYRRMHHFAFHLRTLPIYSTGQASPRGTRKNFLLTKDPQTANLRRFSISFNYYRIELTYPYFICYRTFKIKNLYYSFHSV